MPKLILKFNAAVLKEIPMAKPAMAVGRAPDNDIVIDNPVVSSHHCRVFTEGGAYFVEDNSSTNGTFIAGKKILKAGLKHKDEIAVGKHTLVFHDEAQAAAESGAAPQPAAAAPAALSGETIGAIQITEGAAGGKTEVLLSQLMTYIGKADAAAIKLDGSAPDIAAFIHRKPDGYIIKAVKDGYPRVNGNPVSGEVELKAGDSIECGATKMLFALKPA